MMEEFLSRQTLLVVAPHADDETIQSGGLIQRVKKAGGKVFVLVLSVGNLDHYTTTDEKHTQGSTRVRELAAAMEMLGVDDHEIALEDEHLHLRLDSLPRRDLVTIIERSARLATDKINPTMLAIPAPSFNQDHVAAYHACVTACRPHLASMKSFQRVVLIADAPQLRWRPEQPFAPDFYVTLSEEEVERKVAAYECHASQVRPAPHMGSSEALRDLAKARGMEISVPFAEAYQTLRFVC
ncbi:MAG: PIG-L family deacetylase [Planctomycetes bacterium]|nr:PIG-L family deacetylase [Planctomycetota bacterium]